MERRHAARVLPRRFPFHASHIVLDILESGGGEDQPNRLSAVPSKLSEIQNRAIASIDSKYYIDTRRFFVIAYEPIDGRSPRS